MKYKRLEYLDTCAWLESRKTDGIVLLVFAFLFRKSFQVSIALYFFWVLSAPCFLCGFDQRGNWVHLSL